MSVSREDQGNLNCVAGADESARDELVEVGEVSLKTKGGPVGFSGDIGAGYTWG
jgi:hypothetical protein